MVLLIIVSIIPIVLLIIFLQNSFKIRDSLLDEERELNPIFKEYCWGTIGLARYKGPWIRLNLYDSFMVIGTAISHYLIKYNDIVALKTEMDFLHSSGLSIVSKNKDVPKILIYSKNSDKIIRIIESKRQSKTG